MTAFTYELMADGVRLIGAPFTSFEEARKVQQAIAYLSAEGGEGADHVDLHAVHPDRRGYICRDYTRQGAAKLRAITEENRGPAWDAWRSSGATQDPESGEYIWM